MTNIVCVKNPVKSVNEKKSFYRKINFCSVPALVTVVLSGAYIANWFTPFRLGNDVLRYIQVKEWLEYGGPNAVDPVISLPYGYPLLLLLLSKVDLCTSFFIVLMNSFYLAGSLFFVKAIFKNKLKSWHLITLTLLNWTVIKHTITPLSDMQYMFFSTGTLFFLRAYSENKKIGYIVGLLVFGFLAVLTRTIGVLLLFSIGLDIIVVKRNAIQKNIPVFKTLLIVVILFFLVVALFSDFFRINGYIGLMFPFFRNNPADFFITNMRWHFSDWAELFINTSQFKIDFIDPRLKEPFFLFFVFFFMAYFLWLLAKTRSAIPSVISIYLLGYIVVIFNWPTYDARFWVPVLPLLIAVILLHPVHKNQYLRYAFFIGKTVYISLGVIAIGYYSYLTFNKRAFAERHDAGIWKNEYNVHFWRKPLPDSNIVVREYPLQVLKKYDR